MVSRLFLCLLALSTILFPLSAEGTACLNSSLADLWALAGGSVDITVQDAIDRGFAGSDAILVDGASGRNINSEILISSQPDLVLGSVDTQSHVRLSSLLEKAGIRCLLIQEDSFEDFLSIYRELTAITGRSDLFRKYGIGQSAAITAIRSRCEGKEGPRVLFVRAGSAFSSVKAKRADDHFAALMLEELGAVNVADDLGALTESLSLEAMLMANIDLILVVPQGDEAASTAYVKSLFSQPGWRNIKAVEEGCVVFLSKDLFHFKPNGRWAEAYSVLEEVLYG